MAVKKVRKRSIVYQATVMGGRSGTLIGSGRVRAHTPKAAAEKAVNNMGRSGKLKGKKPQDITIRISRPVKTFNASSLGF